MHMVVTKGHALMHLGLERRARGLSKHRSILTRYFVPSSLHKLIELYLGGMGSWLQDYSSIYDPCCGEP